MHEIYIPTQDTPIYFIRLHTNIRWNRNFLSMNKHITVNDVETLKLPNSSRDWNWCALSRYINIQEVINNPNKPWDRSFLNLNEGITEKILEFFDYGLLKHLQKNIPQFKYHTDIVIKCDY